MNDKPVAVEKTIPTTAEQELAAIRTAFEALKSLDDFTRNRALRWLLDALNYRNIELMY